MELTDRRVFQLITCNGTGMNPRRKAAGGAMMLADRVMHAGLVSTGGKDNGANSQATYLNRACAIDVNGGIPVDACCATYQNLPASNSQRGAGASYTAATGDASPFLAVGTSLNNAVTIRANQPVDQFNGTAINAIAFPGEATNRDRAVAASVNWFPTTATGAQAFFDRIVCANNGDSFETDNHAFGLATHADAAISSPRTRALVGSQAARWWQGGRADVGWCC